VLVVVVVSGVGANLGVSGVSELAGVVYNFFRTELTTKLKFLHLASLAALSTLIGGLS